MSALRLETILISDIINGIGLTIIANIREWAAYNDCLVISADILQLAFLFMQFAVAGLNTGAGLRMETEGPEVGK